MDYEIKVDKNLDKSEKKGLIREKKRIFSKDAEKLIENLQKEWR